MSLDEKPMEDIYLKAHKASFKNMKDLKNDTLCGCFYCLEIYNPKEIVEFVEEDNGEKTAICPYCGVDSVLGKSSGYPINKQFLGMMFKQWFGNEKGV